MEFETVDVFEYKGHKCVIRKVINPNFVPSSLTQIEDQSDLEGKAKKKAEGLKGREIFHNGYVKVAKSEVEPESSYQDHNHRIDTAELTFSGEIETVEEVDGFFFGFDSDHLWNLERPKSRTLESVKERTKELVDEMEQKGIFEDIKDEN